MLKDNRRKDKFDVVMNFLHFNLRKIINGKSAEQIRVG
jgi:hypothetical protein